MFSYRMHLTSMSADDSEGRRISGMYPLCQPCWARMTPRERLPYYWDLWAAADRGPQDLGQWFEIEAAVLDELPRAAEDSILWGGGGLV